MDDGVRACSAHCALGKTWVLNGEVPEGERVVYTFIRRFAHTLRMVSRLDREGLAPIGWIGGPGALQCSPRGEGVCLRTEKEPIEFYPTLFLSLRRCSKVKH